MKRSITVRYGDDKISSMLNAGELLPCCGDVDALLTLKSNGIVDSEQQWTMIGGKDIRSRCGKHARPGRENIAARSHASTQSSIRLNSNRSVYYC